MNGGLSTIASCRTIIGEVCLQVVQRRVRSLIRHPIHKALAVELCSCWNAVWKKRASCSLGLPASSTPSMSPGQHRRVAGHRRHFLIGGSLPGGCQVLDLAHIGERSGRRLECGQGGIFHRGQRWSPAPQSAVSPYRRWRLPKPESEGLGRPKTDADSGPLALHSRALAMIGLSKCRQEIGTRPTWSLNCEKIIELFQLPGAKAMFAYLPNRLTSAASGRCDPLRPTMRPNDRPIIHCPLSGRLSGRFCPTCRGWLAAVLLVSGAAGCGGEDAASGPQRFQERWRAARIDWRRRCRQ